MFGWQELLIILAIVALVFGTKKLRSIGSDVGGAVKGFKDAMAPEEGASAAEKPPESVASSNKASTE